MQHETRHSHARQRKSSSATARHHAEAQPMGDSLSVPPGLGQPTVVEAERNQFSVGSPAACTVFAAEAALQLMPPGSDAPLQAPTRDLLDGVLAACSNLACELCSFSEVMAKVDRFALGLRVFQEGQLPLGDLFTLHQSLLGHTDRIPFAMLLTKPPESIALVAQSATRFVVFDSHRRRKTSGAYFLVFGSLPSALGYVKHMWPESELSARYDEPALQEEMLNTLEVLFVERSEIALEHLPRLSMGNLLNEQLSRKVDQLSRRVAKQERAIEELGKIAETGRLEGERVKTALLNFTRSLSQLTTGSIAQQQRLADSVDHFSRELGLGTLSSGFSELVLVTPSRTPPADAAAVLMDCKGTADKQAFDCVMCKRRFSIEFVFTMSACDHRMCRACARATIGGQVQKKSYPIKCPECLRILDPNDVTLILSPSEIEEYENNRYSHYDRR